MLVEVHSVGISFPDLLLSRGEYQFKPEPPFTLGVDFAGVVLDPGAAESSGFTVGQRVAGVNLHGGAAEQVANPVIFTFALPDEMSYDEGAALPMNYLTALFALEERGGLRDRETVLVHGAAGGVGTATLQVAKGLGARTIAVVSTQEKADFARAAGADEVIVGPDFKRRGQGAHRRQGRRRGPRRRRRRRLHRLAALPRRAGPGARRRASPPARASRRSRSTGSCSATPTSAASAGARTRWRGPATCRSSGTGSRR